MGETFARFYREKLRDTWKAAFISALAVGLAAHLYKFTNTLPNHDALYFVYDPMDYALNGRWLLSLACSLSTYYDLPWINGLLSLCWIGLTAAVIVDLFEVKDRVAIFLISGLLASFPCVTNSFFFEFTADGYMLAMLLAALTARLSAVGERRVGRLLLAILCLCCCCGVYQAYVSFALLLAVCHFMLELLLDRRSWKELGGWILRQLAVYGGGLLLYWGVWKLCLYLKHTAPVDYQGIGSLGLMDAGALLQAGENTLRTLLRFFLGGDVRLYGWSLYAALNLLFLLALALGLIAAAVRSGLLRRPGRVLLLLFCLPLLPLFACVWYFVSPGVSYHMLMLQSLCVLYLFSVALYDRFLRGKAANAAALLFLVLIVKFTLQANVCYFEMDKCAQRSQAEATEMLTRIHELDSGQIRRIAFLDGGDHSLVMDHALGLREIMVHAHQLRATLLFDQTYASMYLQKMLGASYTPLNADELRQLQESGRTDGMGVWPERDSLRVVGDTAVIRLPLVQERY